MLDQKPSPEGNSCVPRCAQQHDPAARLGNWRQQALHAVRFASENRARGCDKAQGLAGGSLAAPPGID